MLEPFLLAFICFTFGMTAGAGIQEWMSKRPIRELREALEEARASTNKLNEAYMKGYESYMEGLEDLIREKQRYVELSTKCEEIPEEKIQ